MAASLSEVSVVCNGSLAAANSHSDVKQTVGGGTLIHSFMHTLHTASCLHSHSTVQSFTSGQAFCDYLAVSKPFQLYEGSFVYIKPCVLILSHTRLVGRKNVVDNTRHSLVSLLLSGSLAYRLRLLIVQGCLCALFCARMISMDVFERGNSWMCTRLSPIRGSDFVADSTGDV